LAFEDTPPGVAAAGAAGARVVALTTTHPRKSCWKQTRWFRTSWVSISMLIAQVSSPRFR